MGNQGLIAAPGGYRLIDSLRQQGNNDLKRDDTVRMWAAGAVESLKGDLSGLRITVECRIGL